MSRVIEAAIAHFYSECEEEGTAPIQPSRLDCDEEGYAVVLRWPREASDDEDPREDHFYERRYSYDESDDGFTFELIEEDDDEA